MTMTKQLDGKWVKTLIEAVLLVVRGVSNRSGWVALR
jgi:hypothetical protein